MASSRRSGEPGPARSCGRAPKPPPRSLAGLARTGRPRAANDNARRSRLIPWHLAAGLGGLALAVAWLVAA